MSKAKPKSLNEYVYWLVVVWPWVAFLMWISLWLK